MSSSSSTETPSGSSDAASKTLLASSDLNTRPPGEAVSYRLEIDVDGSVRIFKNFRRFQKEVLTEDDWVEIQGKRFLKKSALRKWALACGVSDEVLEQERVTLTGKDPQGDFYWRFMTR